MSPARLLAVGALLVLSATARGTCMPSFPGPVIFPAVDRAESFRMMNLDGDEWADVLVVAGTGSATGGMVTLLGRPDGRFSEPVSVMTGRQIQGADAADFDLDGDDDVVAYDVYRAATVFLRNDRGVLHETAAYSSGGSSSSTAGIDAGDFNGDRKPDFVETFFNTAAVVLMRGSGDGTFTPQTIPTEGGWRVRASGHAVADLDRDGRDDLALAFYGSAFGIAYGKADGFDMVSVGMGLQVVPQAMAIGDLDGNRELDVVAVAGFSVYDVGVVLNAGRRRKATLPTVVGRYGGFNSPVMMDLDGDGRDELVGNGVVARWTADGFVSERFSGLDEVLAEDVDHDGRRDLVSLSDEGVHVVRNLGQAGLDTLRPTVPATATLDFNGDGREDIFFGAEVYFAGPGGSFRTVPYTEADARKPVLGDVDNDGDVDFVFVYRISYDLFVSTGLNNGDGTFTPKARRFDGGDLLEQRLLVDVDGDGNLDLVTHDDRVVGIAIWVSRGKGDGTFAASTKQDFKNVEGRPIAGDFDGDGRVDLLLFQYDIVGIVHNLGNGLFGGVVPWVDLALPISGVPASADLDGDGLDDLIVAGEKETFVVLNRRDTWIRHSMESYTKDAAQPIARDFNRDGILDIFVPLREKKQTSGSATLFLGAGGGAFLPGRAIWTTTGATAVGDFDGDGLPDLSDGPYVRLNTCVQPRRRSVRQ